MFKISVKKQNKTPQAHFRNNACTSVLGFFLCLNDFVNKMYFVYPKFGEMAVFLGGFLSAWKNTKKKKKEITLQKQ